MRFTLILVAVIVCLLPFPTAAQTAERCFPETGHCISGPIRQYWERNGGLAVFGLPISPQSLEQIEGQQLQVQWFERDRLEIQSNGTVSTGRLGVERLEQLGTPWSQGEITGSVPGCIDFPETGHQVCHPAFANYWRSNGGLERFGYPITSEFETTLEGQTYVVQYFERRRFEYHPEIGPESVLLGLLGREVYEARNGAPPQPAPQPAPEAPPTAGPPSSYNACQEDPYANQAPNYPIKITRVDKRAEIVYLQNVSGESINLNGWIMCSIRGNQRHGPISGTLGPGEQRGFPHSGGNIWNNSTKDDGALYNPNGQLISYWRDN